MSSGNTGTQLPSDIAAIKRDLIEMKTILFQMETFLVGIEENVDDISRLLNGEVANRIAAVPHRASAKRKA
jgi:hypothetical protein